MKLYSIYQQFHEDFNRFAYSLAHDYHQAADLVQDAYIKAMSCEDLFEVLSEEQAKGWFFTTIKRLLIDHHRKHKRLVYTLSDYQMVKQSDDVAERMDIEAFMCKLSSQDAKLFSLKYYQGYSTAEISQIAAINASTLRSRLSKIRQQFIKHYERED